MKELVGDFDELQDSYAKQHDMTQLMDTYSKKWADTKREVLHGINAETERENGRQQRHADAEDAIRTIYQTMMNHINEAPPSIEIIRDTSGRASAVKKGDRILQIERGPDGKARGLK